MPILLWPIRTVRLLRLFSKLSCSVVLAEFARLWTCVVAVSSRPSASECVWRLHLSVFSVPNRGGVGLCVQSSTQGRGPLHRYCCSLYLLFRPISFLRCPFSSLSFTLTSLDPRSNLQAQPSRRQPFAHAALSLSLALMALSHTSGSANPLRSTFYTLFNTN